MDVTCGECGTKQVVPRTAVGFACSRCGTTWRAAICAGCQGQNIVRGDRKGWTCRRCGRSWGTKPTVRLKRRQSKTLWVASVSISLILVLVAVLTLINRSHSTTYAAAIDGVLVIDPGEVSISFVVTNTGGRSGEPTCRLSIRSATGAYSGSDLVTSTVSLLPGGSHTYTDTLAISDQGAAYVTLGASNVSCT